MRKKILISICLIAAAAAIWSWSASPAWAYSSYYVYDTYGGTWYDADKSSTNTEDDYMCWAASASDILAWTGWGKSYSTSADSIFKYFQDHWTDNGGSVYYAYEWWFYGTSSSTSGSYVDVAGGGFWKSYILSSYLLWSSNDSAAIANIKYLLNNGYGVSLSVTKGSGGHAITCWGYEYDDSGKIVGLYVTDSDDGVDGLKYYSIVFKNGEWYLQNFYGTSTTWYITEVFGLETCSASVPEPAGMLLLGLGLAGLAAIRRKAK